MAFVPAVQPTTADHFGWSLRGTPKLSEKGEPEICNSVLSGSGRSGGVAVMPDPTAAAPPMVQREAPSALKLSKGSSIQLPFIYESS